MATTNTIATGFNNAQFVALDRDGTVFVTASSPLLSGTTPTNNYGNTQTLGGSTFISTEGVVTDKDGNLFVLDNGRSTLFELAAPGYATVQPLHTVVASTALTGLAIDSQGNLFFTDFHNGVIYEALAPDHTTVNQLSVTFPTGNGLVALAFDSHDNLFITDDLNGAIYELTAASGYSNNPATSRIALDAVPTPTGIAIDGSGNLYVTDAETEAVYEILAPGYTSAVALSGSGDFQAPIGLTFDADGNIFVADRLLSEVREILAPPAVTGVSPATGPLAGGTTITVTGAHFTGVTGVQFGATAATNVALVSNTEVTATLPASGSTGPVDVSVTTANGTSPTGIAADDFTYVAAPAVGGVSPSSGPATGGTAITVTGSGFTGTSAVTVGGAAATNVTVVDDGTLTATTPPGTAGAAAVAVTAPGGTSTIDGSFTYVAGPVVSGISPVDGPTDGGTAVTITGANFTGADFSSADVSVRFGSSLSPVVGVVSGTEIIAESPAGSAGAVDITVITPNGTSATSAADGFSYVAAPTVTALSPASGSSAGGNIVTISGSNFIDTTSVSFGGTTAEFSIASASTITAVAPAGNLGPVDVTVTNDGGTSATGAADRYTYTSGPAVSGVSPATGPLAGSNTVTIAGANFTGTTAVHFGNSAATNIAVVSATQITATAPAGSASTVDVTVTTPNGTSATGAADSYSYVATPTVTAVSPAQGPTTGGTSVTLTGTNFTGTTAVMFGSSAASFQLVNAGSITAIAPPGSAGAVDVTVTSAGGTSATSAADRFTYTLVPTVTAVSPVSGPTSGGTSVTLTGSNFTGATAVHFGAAAATNLNVVSATQITATTPPGSAGAVDITVTSPVGTSTPSTADLFTYGDGPTISAVSPASGAPAGGTAVTLTGANFTGATAVKFGAVSAPSFTVVSATQITTTSPAGTGTVDITVTTPAGTSPIGATDRFAYGTMPSVSAVSPGKGPAAGGTAVTITGTNLAGATEVAFGANAATNVTVVSATQITATSPAGTGTVDVTVTTPDGISATSVADGFTYEALPAISGVTPPDGPVAGGTAVTITGSGFAGATSVAFGTRAASFSVASDDEITATAPPGTAGSVDIRVTTPAGTSATGSADRFTYTALPIVSAISPATGGIDGGTQVMLTGVNFTGTSAVKFGNAAAVSFAVKNAGSITAVAPAGSVGTVDITVTTPQGTSAVSAADRFTYTVGTGGVVYSLQSTLGTTGTTPFKGPWAGVIDSANNHLFIADAGNDRVQVLDGGTLAVVATIGVGGSAGSDNAHLSSPQGVGVDPATGHVLVADTGNNRVQIFDAQSFAYVATLGAGALDAPTSVHLNPTTRELYVADSGNDRVAVFDADTRGLIATIGVTGVAGADNAHLAAPIDAELNPTTNEILVADSGNGRVQRFDAATLAYVATLGGPGLGKSDNAYLGQPVTASFDPASNLVLVADAGPAARVQVFDAMTYGYVLTLSGFGAPAGIVADAAQARLFIGDRTRNVVQVYGIGAPALFASVLPGSRSVELGNSATIFASMINAGTTALQGCQPALPVTAPVGLTLGYQTTDPATNALTGTAGTPAAIAGNNGVQSFLLSLNGTDPIDVSALMLDFDCQGAAPAAVETGVDTVDLTLSATPVADIIALAATPSGNGIVALPAGGAGAFAVATSNLGISSLIVVSADTGAASLPVTLTLCQSNPATGQCLAPPATSVPLSFAKGATPTFSVFVQASGPIALAPATSRIFLRFEDAGGKLHGSTSVAIQAQ